MTAAIIGISSGILLILLFVLLKQFDKKTIYGLILTGIGFIYVGFTWTSPEELITCSVQAVVFVFISYFGMRKSSLLLALGYFLHGSWDLAYHYISYSELIPPQYEFFCLAIDFTIGIYLLMINKSLEANSTRPCLPAGV